MSVKHGYFTMNNGLKIPKYGFGTWTLKPDEKCEEACLEAIKLGYRLLDTAFLYQNEKGVASAVKKCGLPREEIFITSKIWPNQFGKGITEESINKMLKRFDLPYLDLVLLHWPYGNYVDAWKDLEKCVKENKIKSIGLSNFYEKELKEILAIATIKPVINQIECHPFKNQLEFKKVLDKENIILESWAPLARRDETLFKYPEINDMAKKYKKSVGQIILRWHVENGYLPLPKAANPVHIKENIEIFDFTLTPDEVKTINNIKQRGIPATELENSEGWEEQVFKISIKDE